MKINFVFIYITKVVFSFFLRFTGWKIEGDFPNIAKFVAIVAPHTSLLDFWYMLSARVLLNIDYYTAAGNKLPRNVYWLAKKSLFIWPLKRFIRKIGAVPVDRSKPKNIVKELTKIALSNNTFIIGIAPDGTRRSRSNIAFKWKTGFYHLALNAKVPVVSCCIDHSRKTLFIDDPIYLTGNFESDMKNILSFYKA